MGNVEVVEAPEAKPLEDETTAEVDESPDVEVDDPGMSSVDDGEETVATVNIFLEVNDVLLELADGSTLLLDVIKEYDIDDIDNGIDSDELNSYTLEAVSLIDDVEYESVDCEFSE